MLSELLRDRNPGVAEIEVSDSGYLMRWQSSQDSKEAGESASKLTQVLVSFHLHHIGYSIGGPCVPMLWQLVTQERREETKMESPSFCNLILAMISHYF